MAQHGYLREYDEGWDRDDDRDRERGWRGRPERDDGSQDRDRRFMLGDRGHDKDRGFFERMSDHARRSFGDDDRQLRGSHENDWSRGRGLGSSSFGRQQPSGGSDWDRSPRNFSSHQDDHYMSWRNRQLEALDRDYADYCREREQQFHSDFDNWRSNRRQAEKRPQQGQASEEVMELNNPRAEATEYDSTSSPTADATLGTNNSENTAPGRI